MLPALVWLALVLAHAPAAGASTSGSPGNLLVLVADDLGVDELALYGLGPDPAPTPTLDLMASHGLVFTNVWSLPTCSPTRATLQTGRYAFRTTIGSVINAAGGGPALATSEVTLPEMLDLGTGGHYAHAAIGKWHLGTSQTGGDLAPNLAGYAHFAGSLEGQLQNYRLWRRVVNGSAATSRRYATSACVDDALAWIHAQSGPWLCVVNFQAPHAPWHRPPASLHSQVLPVGEPGPICGAPGLDPRPFHKAMVEAMDREIGRLVAQLPPGELADTTVFFLADNGTDACVAGAPFAPNHKGTLNEGGVRVPLIAAGKGVTGRGTSAALVNTCDLFATVAELAGVDLAATLPGVALDSVSFAPSLADPARSTRAWLFAEVFGQNGPGQPPPLASCPPSAVCRPSLGFDGPGAVALASCGPPLFGHYGTHDVPWSLNGAPPFAEGWLVIGPYAPAFVPQLGATLVSPVPSALVPLRANGQGTQQGLVWTGAVSSQAHYQLVLRDAAQAAGFTVSNALRMELLPTRSRALRGLRYKLIQLDPCREELYDLASDPYERTNLLARTLTTAELAAYGELSTQLARLQ
jgi:arylsulfatase A-like enzyme